MATYPTLTHTLAAASAANFATTPLPTEDSAKLADVDLQTRDWVYGFLSTWFTDSGLKSAAYGSSGHPTSWIQGANPTTNTARDLAPKTVQTEDIADGAVSTLQIEDQAVSKDKVALKALTADQIQDSSLTAALLAADAITTAKILQKSVTADKLADACLETRHFGTSQIRKEHLLDNQVDGTKLINGALGEILVGGQTGNTFAPKKLTGVMEIDADGVTRFVGGLATSVARVVEKAPSQSGGGISVSATWNIRGGGATSGIPWTIETFGVSNFVRLANVYEIEFLLDGIYLIMASAPAYKADEHVLRMQYYAVGTTTQHQVPDVGVQYGTTEFSYNSVAVSTRSSLVTMLQISQTALAFKPKLWFEHFTQTGYATNQSGLGFKRTTTAGPFDIFAEITIVKLG